MEPGWGSDNDAEECEVDWGASEDDAGEGVSIEGDSGARGSGDGVPPPTPGALMQSEKR